jgi:hypothetical protein
VGLAVDESDMVGVDVAACVPVPAGVPVGMLVGVFVLADVPTGVAVGVTHGEVKCSTSVRVVEGGSW